MKTSYFVQLKAGSDPGPLEYESEAVKLATLCREMFEDPDLVSTFLKGGDPSLTNTEGEIGIFDGVLTARLVVEVAGEGKVLLDKPRLSAAVKKKDSALKVEKRELPLSE